MTSTWTYDVLDVLTAVNMVVTYHRQQVVDPVAE